MTNTDLSPLEATWRDAACDAQAERAFLEQLSESSVVVILLQPHGPGAAAPERNLARWRDETRGEDFTPVFTDTTHLSMPVPPPARAVRVPLRVLLAAGGDQRYVVNPGSPTPFELDASRLTELRQHIAARSQESTAPSRHAPWTFRFPDDALYPVAMALARWIHANERVDEAYLYEVTQGKAVSLVVLGLDSATAPELAGTLTDIAVKAGADSGRFVVRFLPVEHSHRAGIEAIGLDPFYRRP